MAIVTKKRKVAAARESTSLHFSNETTKAVEESKQPLLNHQTADTLIDPEDTTDDQGSTHFTNDTKYSKKTNRLHTTAAKKPVLALEVPEAFGKKVPKDEAPADEATEASLDDVAAEDDGCETGLQDTQHMPNDIDPTEGYLTTGSEEGDDEFDEDLEDDEDEIDASAEFEEGTGTNPQSLLEADDEEWDPDSAVVAEFGDEDGEDEFSEEDESEGEAEVEAAPASDDDMSVVDVDGTDDEGDDVVFASIGLQLHAIKANRIIASIGKKRAIKAGHGDVYLSDQFQDVVGVEMSKHGLRAGLQKMGFALATFNVAKNEVVNKRVEAKAAKVTSAVRRTTHQSNEALGQCLAIAAVGINRQYFKDARNELRASLEEELEAAGVRGASRLVRKVFASKGVDYAKAILTLANKLVNMPETTRNQFAAALDMTNDGEIEDDEDLFAEPSDPEFVTAEGEDEEFDDEFEDENDAPSSVQAALARPASKVQRREINAAKTGYSVTAMAILSGKAPLPFA
jgi:hypothetical protein